MSTKHYCQVYLSRIRSFIECTSVQNILFYTTFGRTIKHIIAKK